MSKSFGSRVGILIKFALLNADEQADNMIVFEAWQSSIIEHLEIVGYSAAPKLRQTTCFFWPNIAIFTISAKILL